MPLMWDNGTEIKGNIFGRVWLINTENKQMQTCNIKWNYSSHEAGGFLYKCSPHIKYNWYCIIGIFINAVPLFHPTLTFFRKEFNFFSNVYISVGTIFKCCYKLTNLLVVVVILRHSTKFCVKEIKKKICYINQKKRQISPKSLWEEEEDDFSVEKLGPSFKVNVYWLGRSHGVMET